jgi:hypothetical protein
MTHTPGPWHVAGRGIVSGNECCLAVTETYSAMQKLSPAQREANAYLIAAAPELLNMVAALVGLLEDENGHQFIAKALQEGKALWEKASGETWKDEELEEDDDENEVEVEVEVEGEQA